MIKELPARKIGMVKRFDADGNANSATVLLLFPSTVIQKKTKEKDGYEALQIGFEEIAEKKRDKVINPLKGHFKKSNTPFFKHLQEIKADEYGNIEIGQVFDVSDFENIKKIDVTGISKGRGFTGVVKRHGFHGGPSSHGHRLHRTTGSIGASADPARVMKGKKMPGRHGYKKTTIQNLEVLEIKQDFNVMIVKGAVPGPTNRLLTVRIAKKTPLKTPST